jgi:transcriptional regulator with XRE-family HTH domain
MGTTLKDKVAQLTPERRARIEAEADRLHAEYQTLKALRKARDLTQAQLAATLGIRQATIAQLEKRSDLMISTLRSYVEAMGGRLRLTVEFPDRAPVSLEGLGDTEEPRPRRRAPGRGAGVPEENRVDTSTCYHKFAIL